MQIHLQYIGEISYEFEFLSKSRARGDSSSRLRENYTKKDAQCRLGSFRSIDFFLPALQLLHLLLMNVASRVTLPPRLLPYYSFAAGLSSIRP